MPTNYTGVSTDAQAPGGAPEPEGAPLIALPADADPPNASTYIQPYKALADWIAFALRPQAKIADWAKAITRWRSSAGKQRFGIDHMGFPMGQLNQWHGEIAAPQTTSPAGGILTTAPYAGGLWTFGSLQAATGSGGVTVRSPNLSSPFCPTVRVAVGNTTGDWSYAARLPPAEFCTALALAMEWDAKLVTLDYGNSCAMGFNAPPVFAANTDDLKAQFYGHMNTGNWLCQVCDGVGGMTSVDSTVPLTDANTVRFRIEYHGSDVDEASTNRVVFLINGAVVANIPIDLGVNFPLSHATPLFAMRNAGATVGGAIDVSSPRGCNNLWTDAF